jgi:hypothetical protein
MTPSAAPFEPFYTALKSLRQKVSNYTTTSITLPHRPENLSTDLHPYLDNAIVTLSTSTAYLYDDNAPWAIRVVEVKEGVERVDTKVDEVKAEVAEVKAQVDEVDKKVDEVDKKVDEVDKKVDEVKTQMKLLEERLENQIDNVRSGVNNGMAIQLNSLRKWLDDPIQPVSASVQIEGRQRYTVAAGFPTTVREFWRLVSDKSTLVRLAKHYSVVGWEWWRRSASYDSDATPYDTIENAVAAHPGSCLRALAMTWGLQYSALERKGEPSQARERGLGKRKADTDNGSRRVRAREDRESDSASQAESISSQDINDQESQQSRVISVQIRVPSNAERRDLVERMMAAAARDERRRNGQRTPSDPPEDPYERLEWRFQSTSTERRWRRLRETGRSSVHISDIQDPSPREGLNQSAPSTVPFGSATREELRLGQSAPREELGQPAPREEPIDYSSLDIYGSITTESVRCMRELSRPLSSGSEGEATEH